MENSRDDTLRLAREFAAKGEPDGWFEEFYARAGGDIDKVYWADLEPGPHLVAYLERRPAPEGGRAVTIGCGLGDDAECLAAARYGTVAFNISPAAIDMCVRRYADTAVDYRVADLFDLPADWARSFDLVYECNTIQVLPGEYRIMARDAMISLLAPGGTILVSCRSREQGELEDEIPLPLDKEEIDGFVRCGLTEESFVAYDDDQDPPVPHFFATYRK